jgi:hypothetical protein
MRLLREGRGRTPSSSAVKVTLLDPDDHAAALAIMRAHGREPMSMSHGDVDYGYLERLVLGPGGRPRLRRVSFAAHFDSLMFGRRAAPRPPDEASLNPTATEPGAPPESSAPDREAPMPQAETVAIGLAGIQLTDADSGQLVPLAGIGGVQILVLLRHRH